MRVNESRDDPPAAQICDRRAGGKGLRHFWLFSDPQNAAVFYCHRVRAGLITGGGKNVSICK